MPTLYIRDIPEESIEKLDKIAEKEKLSRNQLCCNIIEKYLCCKENFVQEIIPDIISSYIRTELKSFEVDIKRALDIILICSLRMSKTNEKLNDFLFPELEKLSVGSLDSAQILSILNSEKEISDDEIERIINEI